MSEGVFRGSGKQGLTGVALDEVIRDLCETRTAVTAVVGEIIGLRADMNEDTDRTVSVLEQILAATQSLHAELGDMQTALRESRAEVNTLTAAATALGADHGSLRTAIQDLHGEMARRP